MRLLARTQGMAFVEFLLAFMPMFLLFLGGVQLAFLVQAHAVVRHAALRAARTAVITIDDDPYFYGGEPRKLLATDGTPSASSCVEAALGQLTSRAAEGVPGQERSGGERLARIRSAAYLPLSAISPTRQQVARWLPLGASRGRALDDRSLFAATGDEPLSRLMTGFGVYARLASAITFPTAPGSSQLRDTDSEPFGDGDAVTARVTFLYPCMVPVVRALVCRDGLELSGMPEQVERRFTTMQQLDREHLRAVSAFWQERFAEGWRSARVKLQGIQHAEWPLLQLLVLAQDGERFALIRHEATLPNHGAAYPYHSEREQARPPGAMP